MTKSAKLGGMKILTVLQGTHGRRLNESNSNRNGEVRGE